MKWPVFKGISLIATYLNFCDEIRQLTIIAMSSQIALKNRMDYLDDTLYKVHYI